ncbi:MAG: MGMT family protein [Candidatus Sungbacteria bacterium]|nr:MGMT family protein [Candidatus Sungbacteria bacterium]
MTPFEKNVYAVVRRIPKGKVLTYQSVAHSMGRVRAGRAVGNALNKNNSPLVPCHRVIKGDGSVGGFNGGTSRKMVLLEKEGIKISKGRIELSTYLHRGGEEPRTKFRK